MIAIADCELEMLPDAFQQLTKEDLKVLSMSELQTLSLCSHSTYRVRIVDRQSRNRFREPLDERYEPFSSGISAAMPLLACLHP